MFFHMMRLRVECFFGRMEGMSDMIPASSDYIVGKNGVLIDPETRRFVGGKNIATKITGENSIAYHRKRQEKTQAAIREGMRRASGKKTTYEATALGAEYLYRDVLDPDQDLDKRRKAWLSVNREAGMFPQHGQTLDNDTVQSLAIADSLVAVRDIIHELVKSNGTV